MDTGRENPTNPSEPNNDDFFDPFGKPFENEKDNPTSPAEVPEPPNIPENVEFLSNPVLWAMMILAIVTAATLLTRQQTARG